MKFSFCIHFGFTCRCTSPHFSQHSPFYGRTYFNFQVFLLLWQKIRHGKLKQVALPARHHSGALIFSTASIVLGHQWHEKKFNSIGDLFGADFLCWKFYCFKYYILFTASSIVAVMLIGNNNRKKYLACVGIEVVGPAVALQHIHI